MSLLPSAALIHAGRAGSNYSRQLSTSPLLLSGLHSSTQQLRSPSHHTPSPSLLHNAWLAAPRREHRSAVTWVPVPRTASATATSSALPSVIRRLSASLPLSVLSAYHQHRRRAWGSSAAATLGGAPFALTAILLYFTDGSGSDAHCYSAADAAALGSGSGAGVWGPLVRSNRSGGGGTSTAGSAAASSDGGRTRGGAPQQQSRGGAFRFSALGISSAASATDDDEQYARDFDDVDDAAYDMAAAWPHELGFQLTLGSVAGFCSGYAVKKVSKVVAFSIGVVFIGVQVARYNGLISDVDWRGLEGRAVQLLDADGDGKITHTDLKLHLEHAVAVLGFNLPSGAAFGAAFLLGLRWG